MRAWSIAFRQKEIAGKKTKGNEGKNGTDPENGRIFDGRNGSVVGLCQCRRRAGLLTHRNPDRRAPARGDGGRAFAIHLLT